MRERVKMNHKAAKAPPAFEYIWDGKYDRNHKRRELRYPENAHLVEQAQSSARNNSPPTRNRLIHAENLMVGAALRAELCSSVRLVYIDPPFNLGRVHHGQMRTNGGSGSPWRQGLSLRDVAAYDDRWGRGEKSFAHMLWQRLTMLHEWLCADGSLLLHCNDHSAPLVRALLDDVFGEQNFLNQIVWHYTGGGRSRMRLSNKHDLIFWYRKGKRHVFNRDAIRVPYKSGSGYAKSGIVSAKGKRYLPHPQGTPVDDVWEIPMVNPMAHERTGYPTQKPLELLRRIIAMASEPGDLVADIFCGSGTTAVAAQQLGRRWIAVDQNLPAIRTAQARVKAENANFSLWKSARHNIKKRR